MSVASAAADERLTRRSGGGDGGVGARARRTTCSMCGLHPVRQRAVDHDHVLTDRQAGVGRGAADAREHDDLLLLAHEGIGSGPFDTHEALTAPVDLVRDRRAAVTAYVHLRPPPLEGKPPHVSGLYARSRFGSPFRAG